MIWDLRSRPLRVKLWMQHLVFVYLVFAHTAAVWTRHQLAARVALVGTGLRRITSILLSKP